MTILCFCPNHLQRQTSVCQYSGAFQPCAPHIICSLDEGIQGRACSVIIPPVVEFDFKNGTLVIHSSRQCPQYRCPMRRWAIHDSTTAFVQLLRSQYEEWLLVFPGGSSEKPSRERNPALPRCSPCQALALLSDSRCHRTLSSVFCLRHCHGLLVEIEFDMNFINDCSIP